MASRQGDRRQGATERRKSTSTYRIFFHSVRGYAALTRNSDGSQPLGYPLKLPRSYLPYSGGASWPM